MKNYIQLIAISLLISCVFSGCGKDGASSSSEDLSMEETAITEESSDVPSSSEESLVPSSTMPVSSAVSSKTASKPAETVEDWKLFLVNRDNPIPGSYVPSLTAVRGYQVDARISDALTAMLNDCVAAGLDPKICSAYRNEETQTRLYNAEVQKWINNGYLPDNAKVKAATVVAAPNTSEHQLGLAVDIVARSHQILNTSQEQTDEYKWLASHCQNYGFIVRYPNGKTDKTFVIYEPWHFRYVGVDAAKDIMARGITLEEYLS